MRVVGIGFRRDAPLSALRAAYDLVGPAEALATSAHKAEAPQIHALARSLGVTLHLIDAQTLAQQPVLSHSPAQHARFGTGSLAEAAALAAAGPGARLSGPRVTSPDRQATAALAMGGSTEAV